MLMEEGNFEEADDSKFEGNILELKNNLLVPIYTKLKEIVRQLKKTDVSKLYEEYKLAEELLREKIVI